MEEHKAKNDYIEFYASCFCYPYLGKSELISLYGGEIFAKNFIFSSFEA